MFDLERFVAECRSALRERSPELAVKETVARAMADPGEVERVLGIHAVANPLDHATGAIHVYGGDFFGTPRSEFDPETFEERPYDVERAKRVFLKANERRGDWGALRGPPSRRLTMPAYLIADVTPTDQATMDEYRKQVPATVAKYGGRFLVRGGAHQVVEGEWKPNRLVVIEFPTLEQARRWYDSEEYKGPKALRIQAGRTNLVMVEGIS
jgi:uncharacterized protein (DUF1330 family)